MITPDDITTRFDQFASVSTDKIQLAIDEAVLEVDETNWGDLYDTGLLYLSAHLLTVDPALGGGSSGEAVGGLVTKTTIGRTTVEFANGSSGGGVVTGPHSTSIYGQRYDYYVYNYIGEEVVVV